MITGVVLARNEEDNIIGCLEALRPHVAEILLIDMESEDRTVELARPYIAQVLYHPRVRNFDGARNIAIPEARYEWLWFVDADERIPHRAGRLVNELIRTRGEEFEALAIPFKSYCCGQWMQHCGWWPGYTGPRVLKRGHFQFAQRIHGGVQLDGRQLAVAPDPELGVDHYGIRSVEHYVEKVNRYSTAEAENLARAGDRWNWRTALLDMMREMWLTYEKHPGQLDGERGWVAAWLSGQYRWLAQTKLLDMAPEGEVQPNSHAAPANLDDVLSCLHDSLAYLRARDPRLPLGLVWRAHIWNESGYAEEARTVLKGLARSRRPLALENVFRWSEHGTGIPTEDKALFRALHRAQRPKNVLAVTHGLPGMLEPDERAAVNVLRTMIETDQAPKEWLAPMAQFDEIWTPSRHAANAFRRSGIAPEWIRIVPEFLDTDVFRPQGDKFPLPAVLWDRFVFLSVFDWTPRKGGGLLVENYCREFSSEDGVGLLLKLTRIHGQSLEEIRVQLDALLQKLGQSLVERPDIVLIDQTLTLHEMAALYRSGNAFVMPSRGEGWGRPYMEAMACGLPTIGTAASGNLEFMHEANSFLIPARQVDVPEEAAREFPLFQGHRWYEPNAQELRRLMRLVTDDQQLCRQVSNRAIQEMQNGYSLEAGAQAIEATIQAVEARLAPQNAPPVQDDQVRVALEGELFAGHSFSNINEQLCRELGRHPSLAFSMQPKHNQANSEYPIFAPEVQPYIGRELPGGPQITIRHAYPPNWVPPEQGLWVHIQPWEYGHLPTEWLTPLRDQVAEIWVPSEYVLRVYERSGIPSEKIQVIPWGIDPAVFTPEAPPLLLPTRKTFRFLYVGGTIARKGFDRLLEAYLAEFRTEDDVCLVVKDVGTDSFYRGVNYREQVLAAQADPKRPEVLYWDQPLTSGQLASLYTACDCFVAPYRGEGFGQPILEAMACGLAPIVPRGGASDDFTSEETAILLTSKETEAVHDVTLCGPLLELSISQGDLRRAMRNALEHHEQTIAKGQLASHQVRSTFTWQKTADRMVERIHSLNVRNQTAFDFSAFNPCSLSPLAPHAICAVVTAEEGDARALADTLARLRPFVDRLVCAAEHTTGSTVQIAREYGAQLVITSTISQANSLDCAAGTWILRLKAGERPDEEGLQRLKSLVASLPDKILGLAARVSLQDTQAGMFHHQWELRVLRQECLVEEEVLGPVWHVMPTVGDSSSYAMSDLEIALPHTLQAENTAPGDAATLPEPWLIPWVPYCGDVFLDVGANIGQWTCALAPGYRQVLAVEPGSEGLVLLKENLPKNAVVHEFAAWSTEEEREFACFANSAHLSACFREEGINTGQQRGARMLSCRPLDAIPIDGQVDFFKCDVEGAEVEVFCGAEQLITEHRPRLLVEVHSRRALVQLIEMLGKWRYHWYVIRHPDYEPFSQHWIDHCWIVAAAEAKPAGQQKKACEKSGDPDVET